MKKDMESQKTMMLAFNNPYNPGLPHPNSTYNEIIAFLSAKFNPFGRLLLALMQYLQQYTNYFDRVNFVMMYKGDIGYRMGTSGGLVRRINCSQIDVLAIPEYMDNYGLEIMDYSYPYKMEDFTFVTRNPEYKPHIFGIFQMFSLSVWLIIISVLIAMPIVTYTILKRKYTFNKISFHVFAILLKQNSLIRPSSLVEKLIVYSWVVGAMILCLSYDSVFLSFLSIPPVTKIKHLSDLALAVERGDYHCVAPLGSGVIDHWKNSKHEHLRAITADAVKNKLSYGDPVLNFVGESHKQNLALVIETKFLYILDAAKFFFSEDHFLESMHGMVFRKGFRYKDLLDSFVHKMMASGIYFKYFGDGLFLSKRVLSSADPEHETTNRKLTLTDLAPAFIFLLCGYFISFLVLLAEIYSSRKKMNNMKKDQKKKGKKVYAVTHV